MRAMANDIHRLITDFAGHLAAAIEGEALDKARRSVLAAFGIDAHRPVGRPLKAAAPVPTKVRRKAPLQLCPVPGCRNAAAPVFGMVCAKHKDIPKPTIKAYRESRRAKKAKPVGTKRRRA
jgi:hypothetical protein